MPRSLIFEVDKEVFPLLFYFPPQISPVTTIRYKSGQPEDMVANLLELNWRNPQVILSPASEELNICPKFTQSIDHNKFKTKGIDQIVESP